MIPTTLLLLAPVASLAPEQEVEAADDAARLVARLDDLREATLLLAASGAEPSRELLARLDDGARAARAAAASEVGEARPALLRVVDACDAAATESVALDAMAALRAIGEPRSYFADHVLRAREAPHRAAAALRVLADRPDDDLLRLGEAAARACRDLDDGGIAYATVRRALTEARIADSARTAEARLREAGEHRAADRLLLRELWLSYVPPSDDAPLPDARVVHRPASAFARSRLADRLRDDAAGVREALGAMTWRQFLPGSADEPEPADHEERARTFRAQAASMLPEADGEPSGR